MAKWIFVSSYTTGIFVATPFLPQLIRTASSRWSSPSVSRFVLYVEIALAALILVLALVFLVRKKKKATVFLFSVVCIFALSFLIYKWLPNPYEFTHFPEYAVLSILIFSALSKEKKREAEQGSLQGKKITKKIKPLILRNPYFFSGAIAGLVGTTDEIYQYFLPKRAFTWYDILLNIIGGILGLLIVWVMRK